MMTSTPPSSSAGGQMCNGGGRLSDSGFSITDITLEQALSRIKDIENENRLHRDNLREHNAMMREQCENLALWRKRENDKFEQAKALITALRGENQDLQIQIMTLTDKEKATNTEMGKLNDEKCHIQRQKAISEQRVFNILKLAEAQGLTSFIQAVQDKVDITEQDTSAAEQDNIVFVSTSEKEGEIERLEALLANKEEAINELMGNQHKKDQEIENLRNTRQHLLNDMEGQQQLKQSLEEENRSLRQQLMEANQHQVYDVKSRMADAKREMLQRKEDLEPSTSQASDDSSYETSGLPLRPPSVIGRPGEPEDLTRIMQSLETEKQEELAKQNLQRRLLEEQKLKQECVEEIDVLKHEVEKLKSELENEKREAQAVQHSLEKDIDVLTQQYEEKLSKQSAPTAQPCTSEEPSILRSQVLTLIKDLDEVHTKNSKLNSRIQELEGINQEVQAERESLWQERNGLIQNLRIKENQQLRAQQETESIKRQYQQLQDSFSKLVTDFKDLEETSASYQRDMENRLATSGQRMSRQEMEERDHLQAQILAAEEALARKDERLAELRSVEEQFQVLKIQLDVYQNDFREERVSRTKLAEERAKLIDQVNKLQDQNRDLRETFNQQQIHNMQARHAGLQNSHVQNWNYPPGRNTQVPAPVYAPSRNAVPGVGIGGQYSDRNAAPSPFAASSHQATGGAHGTMFPEEDEDDLPSLPQFECPFCHAKFPDTDTVQLHVTECLERN